MAYKKGVPTPSKADPYAPDNLRYRRACIRDRLSAMKEERIALLAEREEIDLKLKIDHNERTATGPKPKGPATDAVKAMATAIDKHRKSRKPKG